MHPSARNLSDLLEKKHGFQLDIKEFPEGTRTAEDAAEAVGSDTDQIVKSLVMKSSEEFYLVLCSGENKVNLEEMSKELEVEKIDTASPDEVKDITGWSIGGVPPIGLDSDIDVFMDPDLLDMNQVWAAAGTPEAVFNIDPTRLKSLSRAEVKEFFQ